MLRDAEEAAAATTGGNLSALISDAVVQHVKVRRGRELMREDREELGPVGPDVLGAVDAEWPG